MLWLCPLKFGMLSNIDSWKTMLALKFSIQLFQNLNHFYVFLVIRISQYSKRTSCHHGKFKSVQCPLPFSLLVMNFLFIVLKNSLRHVYVKLCWILWMFLNLYLFFLMLWMCISFYGCQYVVFSFYVVHVNSCTRRMNSHPPLWTGKSTLLNHLFHTNFREMDAYRGRLVF